MAKSTTKNDNFFVRLSRFFFVKWRLTFVLWVVLLFAGTLVYTNLIKREGFPSIQFPLTIVSGQYLADAETVDTDIAKPLAETLGGLDDVDSISTSSGTNFFTAIIFFEEGITSADGTALVQKTIEEQAILPAGAVAEYTAVDPASFLNDYDVLLSVYSREGQASVAELGAVAQDIARQLDADNELTNVTVKPLEITAQNPASGKQETRQIAYNYYGFRESEDFGFYKSVTIGLDREGDLDVIELSEYLDSRLPELTIPEGYGVRVSADFADSIENQISSLQSNLLGGLAAVAVVSLLLISWRASVITALFMISVMAITILVLFLVGYTLNTITLFALVLALGLFVDDATIIVEALDANRRKGRKSLEVAKLAIKRVASASFAGTMTTVLVFVPMIFISGVLGEFIRIMPVTIIIALITSLLLSLVLIPFLGRFILLRQQTVKASNMNPIPALERKISSMLESNLLLLRTRPKKGRVYGLLAVAISFVFVGFSFYFFNRLTFNIFPASKDSDQLAYEIDLPPGYTIEEAQQTVGRLNQTVIDSLGENVQSVAYGYSQNPNERVADAYVELVPFNERDKKSPQIISELESSLQAAAPEGVEVKVIQIDAGPPAADYPLQIQVYDENEERAAMLAEEVRQLLDGATLTRPNGTTAQVSEVRPVSTEIIARNDGRRLLTVEAAFDADDVSALLVEAEELVQNKFTDEYLTSNGYSADALGFDFGQETENANSFASLSYVFPIALLAMYILLASQFRSLLQPLLIFLAIPFSLLGVSLGLFASDNSLSFFVMVGLIGLIGIAVNNTILLTDYANQEKRAGKRTLEAVASATEKRFRPLITTSLTTIVALMPLALTDPFWEPLALTIMCGLLSSTFLVVVAFPYYYILAEWLRTRFSVLQGIGITVILIALAAASVMTGLPFILIPFLYVFIKLYLLKKGTKA